MHAYLLIGSEKDLIKQKALGLSRKLKAQMMEFSLIKIEDVRSLGNLIRLSFEKPTLIFCPDIDKAGEEALNAFLKNLEEPQENIYFVLSATSTKKVLPTITSRCQIINVKGTKDVDNRGEIAKFLKMGVGEKLNYIGKIKDRGAAVEFAENVVFFMHRSLRQDEVKYSKDAGNIKLALETLTRLKMGGNVNLQLSNFVINYK